MVDNQIHILLVEDDEVEQEAIRRGFARAKMATTLHCAGDGIEALEILRGIGRPPLPDPFLILLDLNMPRMNGFEFLTELRMDPDLRDAVVFVLTTSEIDRDRMAAYGKNIAGYILKSSLDEDFDNLVTMLDHYRQYVQLPDRRTD